MTTQNHLNKYVSLVFIKFEMVLYQLIRAVCYEKGTAENKNFWRENMLFLSIQIHWKK